MSDKMPLGCAAVGLAGVLIIAGAIGFAKTQNEETRACTVAGKESISRGEDGHEYRVYTEECGTLSVTDTIWKMRFDSADTYGSLREGETYEMTTIGWRVPWLSMMPNIIEATPTREAGTLK